MVKWASEAAFATLFVGDRLQRARIGLYAYRVVRHQADLGAWRLFEVAIRGLAGRVLPNRQRAFGMQRLVWRPCIGGISTR